MSILQNVENDIKAFIADVDADGKKVIAWIEKEVPAATDEINDLGVQASNAAQTIASLVSQDATGAISNLAADIETALANYAQISKLPTTATTQLTTVETDAIKTAQTIATAAVNIGLTKILALVAPVL